MYISISVFLRYFVFLTVYSCKRYVFVGLRLYSEKIEKVQVQRGTIKTGYILKNMKEEHTASSKIVNI